MFYNKNICGHTRITGQQLFTYQHMQIDLNTIVFFTVLTSLYKSYESSVMPEKVREAKTNHMVMDFQATSWLSPEAPQCQGLR